MKANSEGSPACNNPDDGLLLCSVGNSTAPETRLFAKPFAILEEVKRKTAAGKLARLAKISELRHPALVHADFASLQEKLEQSEERFRQLAAHIKDSALFMLDSQGNVLSWNEGARKITGYWSEEVLGKHCSVFYPAEDVRARNPERALQQAASEGRYEHEGWRVRKDGSHFWANVVVAAVFKDERLIGFWNLVRDDSKRQALEESVRNLSERLLKVRDEERSRLGRELHDSTAQTLGALAINLALLKEYLRCSPSPEVSQMLTELTDLAQQASREIRNTAYLLHPPMLEEADLPSALGRFVEGFIERTKIQVSLDIEPGLNRIPKEIEMALFRVVQECLSNVYRHSGSPTARVRLAPEPRGILLEVSDKGIGLTTYLRDQHQDASSSPGMGISGMRERIQQLGGSFEVCSTKPGFAIKAVVPLGPAGGGSEARNTSQADDLLSLTSGR